MQRRILKSLKAVFDVGVGFTSQALMIQIQIFASQKIHISSNISSIYISISSTQIQEFTSQVLVIKNGYSNPTNK